MKQKFLICILILFMFSLCGCYKDGFSREMYDLYTGGGQYITKYYNPHSEYKIYSLFNWNGFEQVYQNDNEYFLDFESVITFTKNTPNEYETAWFDKYIFRCYTNIEAIKLQKLLNIEETYNFDTYTRDGKFVYIDCQISYLFLYGEPLEKEGYLYYELDNGDILLFGDVCNCESKVKSENTETIIPNWVNIIGGGPYNSFYNLHQPKAKTLIIPDSVKEIKTFAFIYSKYEKIVLSNGLEKIDSEAFKDCKNLKEVVIPKSVEHIGYHAFTYGTLYCEAESKPKGWNQYFAGENVKVYYANEWEYDENGNPKVK